MSINAQIFQSKSSSKTISPNQISPTPRGAEKEEKADICHQPSCAGVSRTSLADHRHHSLCRGSLVVKGVGISEEVLLKPADTVELKNFNETCENIGYNI
jgi:hypothetical protein